MKKVLFCAAMVAAMSMAFVACGKKKAAEEDEEGAPAGQFQQGDAQDQGAAFDDKGCCGDKAAYGEKDAYEYDKAAYGEKDAYEYDKAAYDEKDAYEYDYAAPVQSQYGSISRAEEAVRACEAATSVAQLEAIEQQYSDIQFEDFTPEQQARLGAVAAKFGL